MRIPAYAITLESTPERTQRLAQHLLQEGIAWTRWEGVDAAKWGLTTTHPYTLDGSQTIVPQKHVGLHLSHWMLWQHIWVQGHEETLVLEDDAQFEPGWRDGLALAFDSLPSGWQILLIGSGNTFDKPRMAWRNNVWSVRYPQCTHAYIVRRSALPTLIATQQKAWAPIDISLAVHSYPSLNTLTVLPRLVTQHGQPYIAE